MRALVKTNAGSGGEMVSVPVGTPGDHDILVKIKAAAICGTDIHIYDWTPYAQARVKPPMVFGHEFCGEVVEVGKNVSRVQVGDLIAGETHIPCGHCFLCDTGLQHICKEMKILGVHVPGIFSEWAVIPESIAWKLPGDFSPKIGAVLEPAGVAVHAVYAADVRGATLVVTGCGPIGLVAIGAARALGAARIIVSDISQKRLEMAREWGADLIVNPRSDNLVEVVRDATKGLGADVVIEASGAASAVKDALKSVRRAGAAVLFGLPGGPVELDLVEDVIYKEILLHGITGRAMWGTWYQVMDLVSSGAIDLDKLVTHEFDMSQFQDAFKVAKSGEVGKVLLYPEG